MSNDIVAKPTAELSSAIEQVVVEGDLSRLNPEQRVDYYRTVCQSIGLNPYTRPFDYLRLNGKLTLYARKDATDQLRKIHGVNIDDIQKDSDGDWFIVTVKGSDREGRRDVEMGVVNKKDMQGNFGNAMMKAVTKAKRRLTLSLCGLGWLDETELETIPRDKMQLVDVDDSGNIVEQARIENKAVVVENHITSMPEQQKPIEAQETGSFDVEDFLLNWKHLTEVPCGDKMIALPKMTLDFACDMATDKGTKKMADCTVIEFKYMLDAYYKRLNNPRAKASQEDTLMRISAVNEIMTAKANAKREAMKPKDPALKGE